MLDLRLLSHALALAEHGSFARAARAVHLSQPALSRSIQSLESQLGVILFERGQRGVRPTDAGQLVLNRARLLALQSEDLEREVGVLVKGGGVGLRVACGPYPARLLVGRALARCLAAAPGFRASVEVNAFPKVIRMVEDREADLGICEGGDGKNPELESVPLRRRQGHAVVRADHPLAARPGLTMEDLLEFPLVLTTRLPSRLLGNMLPPGSRQSPPAIRCESIQVAIDVMRRSDAIAFLLKPMIRSALEAGNLAILDFSPDWLHSNFHLITLKDRVVSPAAAMFREMVIAVDGELD
jgi:DNA-binding transcriptional LysR family regulator